MNDISNMKYIHIPLTGHKVFVFVVKKDIEWEKGYFKLNTSIFEDEEYEKLVDETIAKLNTLNNRNTSKKWEAFLLSMITKSSQYSTMRNWAKRKVKNELILQITETEKNAAMKGMEGPYAYL